MATKTIIIGEESEKNKKCIEFNYHLIYDSNSKIGLSMTNTINSPNFYNYIELIALDYRKGVDLMFAYQDKNARNCGVLIIGKWNDGIVE
jgi:hypothetical protein